MTAVGLPGPLWFLMLVPPFPISTAWAYQAYDRLPVRKKDSMRIKDSYLELADLLPVMKNDLEAPAFSRHSQIARMKEKLLAQGARGALMSGSGPVTFGLFSTRRDAERAEKGVALPAGWKSIVSRGI